MRAALVALTLVLFAPSTALASLADEQNQGRELAGQLRSGAKTCGDLSADDFEHIGEYVMGHMLGSTSAHQAMNDRMRLMMGDQGEERMHQLIGKRFAGCANGSANNSGTAMGPGMMNGYGGNGGWGPMMNSSDYSWMMGGTWRNMTRQDWQRLQRQWLGTSATTSSHHGWSTLAIIAAALGAVLLGALATIAVTRQPFRRSPTASGSGGNGPEMGVKH